jgi:hypothetical protein
VRVTRRKMKVKMKKRMAMRKRNQKVRGVNGVTCI